MHAGHAPARLVNPRPRPRGGCAFRPGVHLTTLLVLTMIHPARARPIAPADQTSGTVMILLVDKSESMAHLPEPDVDQAFLTELIQLARLSGRAVRIAAIVFGGEGVKVFGDDHQMPTAAHASLHRALIRDWPKPAGGTPLEAALQECVRMVGAQPPRTDVTVVLCGDGRPDSGRLRPEAFPGVKAEMDRRLKALHEKYQGHPASILHRLAERLETAWKDPETEEFRALYAVQAKAEYARTLEHAAALKKAGIRFVSVDYAGGIPELQEIHREAGGRPADLVLATPPTTVIPKLHSLGLTALPRVIVQAPRPFPAEPARFEGTYELRLDPIGEAALVTLVFEPPVAEFTRHATLEAEVGGNRTSFTEENREPDRIVSLDSAGRVATATLVLDAIPPDGRVVLRYRSPAASLHLPACTAYVHLRIADALAPDFRPVHVPADARPPFRVSPNHPARWVAALRTAADPKPHPIKAVEPVLRNLRDGSEVRLSLAPDPQSPHAFAGEGVRVPPGLHDVDLHVVLESGAQMVLRLPRHVEGREGDEALTMEIPLPAGGQAEGTSLSRGHVDFGEVGDGSTGVRIPILIRSAGVDYPVAVAPSIDGLADREGTAPEKPWITFDRPRVLLQPGRAERLALILRVPEPIEDRIVDGAFAGRLSFERSDLGQVVPVRRYRSISGVPDDEPVDRVTFTLSRPRMETAAPRGLGNAIRRAGDGTLRLPIHVSIWQPFRRTVTIRATHTSSGPREITALASAPFVDDEGKQIPSIRLVPARGCALSQVVPRGGSGTWSFDLEVDDDRALSRGFGDVLLSGPGLPPSRIRVEVLPRRPLLGPLLKGGLWALAGLLAILALGAARRCVAARRFRAGEGFVIPAGQPLDDLFTFEVTRAGDPRVMVHRPLTWRFGDEKPRPAAENRTIPLAPDRLRAGHGLVLEERPDDDGEGRIVRITQVLPVGDGPPELEGEIIAAGPFAEQAARHARGALRCALLAGLAAAAAFTLFTPAVLAACQWLIDLLPAA
jgi:hypothetical protein